MHAELTGALEKWADSGRWENILLAGRRDTAPPTVFDQIIAGDVPSTKVVEKYTKFLLLLLLEKCVCVCLFWRGGEGVWVLLLWRPTYRPRSRLVPPHPNPKVYEDDLCVAFRDANSAAPSHVLLVPKRRDGLTQLRFAADDHKAILGHLLW